MRYWLDAERGVAMATMAKMGAPRAADGAAYVAPDGADESDVDARRAREWRWRCRRGGRQRGCGDMPEAMLSRHRMARWA
jgi:hypothetical protein